MAEHLYQTIARQLRDAIIAGEYRSEDMLPSENELAARYDTSRVTIRKSLGELENEGLVRAIHGKGYFVEHPRHTSFALDFEELRPAENTHYRSITVAYPDEEVRSALRIPENVRVVVTRSVIERGEETIACDEKFVPYERGIPTVEKEIDYVEFTDMFAERFPPVSIWIEMSLAAAPVPEKVAREFGCEPGTKLLTARRIFRSRSDERIGYSRRWFAEGYGSLEARSGYYVTGRV